MSEGQLYRLVVTATGEVRDAEGNLVSSTPVEAEMILTEDQAREYMANRERQQAT